MKLAVLTIAMGEKYQQIGQLTHPWMKDYAQRIGADFHVITEQKVSQTTPHWEKFQILDFLNTYDRIIYLDTDILVKKDCPNLFDEVPEYELGAFNESPFTERRDFAIAEGVKEYGFADFKWNGTYYNTGVMVISRCHRSLFRKPERELFNFYEQTYLNLVFHRDKVKMFNLDYKYNRMTCMDERTGEERYASYMIHYAGIPDLAEVLFVINKDKEIIKNLPENYSPKRKIWINVQGGLGDQVQAEPTIRFLLEHIYKNQDVRVSTHFPEIFSHLNIRVEKHGTPLWTGVDTHPFMRITLPGPETPQWRVVSNLMCHTLDFCSMAVLGRILPDLDKTVQLQVPSKSLHTVIQWCNTEDFSKCVIVHAGKHWESKTFPQEWWQAVVDGLIDKGFTPVIVGKDEETRGVVKVDGRGKSIDLTNLLDLRELFAIIALCPYLISNDSAPIHIAGAFDNYILLIPTCKHEDHLLPYRYGSKRYKTAALSKKLVFDEYRSAPTEIYTSLADKMPGPWNEYLPEASDVVKQIEEWAQNSKDG